MKHVLGTLCVLLLAGCPDSNDEEAPSDTGSTALTWQEMDFDQRTAYMASDVLPAMQEAFAEHDPERFGTITCATCHGSGAEDGSFAMPSDALVPIDVNDYPVGPDVTFMETVVVPQVAALLDMEPFNPETFEGFGCFGCHPAAM